MAFKSRWSAELRAACLEVVLERGWTATAAHAAAVAGRLQYRGENVPAAPELPVGTVRDWARLERSERSQVAAAAAGPDVVLSRHLAELSGMLDRERAKTRRALARGKATPEAIGRLARAGLEVAKLARALQSPGSSPRLNGAEDGASSTSSAAPAEPGFIDGLAATADA
jgi:hypothetical protein